MKKQLPTFMSSLAALSMLAAPVVARELPQVKELPQTMRQEVMSMQKQALQTVENKKVSLRGGAALSNQQLSPETRAITGAAYRTKGMYNFGFGPNFEMYSVSGSNGQAVTYMPVMGAAYAPLEFVNTSEEGSSSFTWTYLDPTSFEAAASTDKDLTVTYPFAIVDMPVLSNGSSVFEYANGGSALFCGGTATIDGPEGAVETGICNYEMDKRISSSQFIDGKTIFGSGNPEFWGQMGDGIYIEAICNYFQAPASPYILSSVSAWLLGTDVDDDAEFTMKIRRIDAEGFPADVVAQSTIYGEDIIKMALGGSSTFDRADFPVLIIDEATGLEEEGFVVIDYPIIVELYGANDAEKVRLFDPMTQAGNFESGIGTLYGYFNIPMEDGSVFNKYIPMHELLQGQDGTAMASAAIFNMDVIVPFLHAPQNTFSVPAAGGNVPVAVSSLFTAEGIFLAEELPSWVKMTNLQEEQGMYIYTFAFEALPAGEEGRQATVTLESLGCSAPLVFTQGVVSGIENTQASAFKASFVMDQLHVFYPEGVQSVAVFSTSGQLVKQFALDGSGAAVLDAPLAKGTYLLSFAGKQGMTVKVVK